MFDLDHWREIVAALGSNKLRTALTAFGVFWGIFMLMVMLGSGTGLENGVVDRFDGATNSFFVWSRSTTKPYRGLPAGRPIRLVNEDTAALRAQVSEAGVICPRNQLGGWRGGNNVTRGARAGAFSVMGDYPEIRVIEGIKILDGRFLNPYDLDEQRKVAVIGTRVRGILFDVDEDPIGQTIRINGVTFKVVGTFRSTQDGEEANDEAQTIFIPFTTFQRAFNFGNYVGWWAITSADGVPASLTEARVKDVLKQRHRIHPDDDRALGSWNTEEEFGKIQGLFAGIRGLVWIVGIGTLTAGVIGVSNIMLVIVKERTKEIGIRRAIGARPWTIKGQIILEAILLTATAGYVGLIGGMGLMELINHLMSSSGASPEMFRNPEVSLEAALQALLILVIAGVLAGLIPAQRALKISPVQALRAE